MNRRIVFTTSTEIIRVPPDSVVYFTADGNYTTLTTADREVFVLTLQLGQIERQLAERLDPAARSFQALPFEMDGTQLS